MKNLNWDSFKKIVCGGCCKVAMAETDAAYVLYTNYGGTSFECIMYKNSTAEVAEFEANLKEKCNTPIE